MKKFKCRCCDEVSTTYEDLVDHLEAEHADQMPKNYSPRQFEYALRTGKTEGKCVVCGMPTGWNDVTNKYHRFCTMPKCKTKYREKFKANMIGKFGTIHLLNDPDQQKKMLANRSISGTYKWTDGGETPYTGSYEKDFLYFLDVMMNYSSEDIMAPSPHVYYYMYKGEKKFYMPDFFIPSLNLEIEVKDGGDNPNNHHKIQEVDKMKEHLKDQVLMSQKAFSYIKVTNKGYGVFFDFLHKLKEQYADTETENDKPIFILRESVFEGEGEIIMENQETMHRHIPLYSLVTEVNGRSYVSIGNAPDKYVRSYTMGMNGFYKHVDANEMDRIHEQSIPYQGFVTYITQDEQQAIQESLDQTLRVSPAILVQQENYRAASTSEYHANMLITSLIDVGDSTAIRERMTLPTASGILTESGSTELRKLKALADRGQFELVPVFVLLTHSGTMLANAIRNFTKNPYSHSSISFDTSLDHMYSFGRKYKNNPLIGTFVKESIRQGLYQDVSETATYSLYVTFVTRDQATKMESKLQEFKDNKEGYKYNFTGLIKHSLGIESHREDAYFCSEFVDTIFKASGKVHFKRGSSLVKPYDFAQHKDFHFVAKGLLKNYSEQKVQAKVAQMSLSQQLPG